MAPYQITSAKITSKTMVMICSSVGIGCLSMTRADSTKRPPTEAPLLMGGFWYRAFSV
ncbi:hypothetical protein ABIF29_009623 [Bradyrhizobium elkanii]|uniref:Uncharacterized protein n=1 Tax=Bradyrhizobium elkanii TaxID=29448 RepID=A0ABV4FH49_BRAEL